MLGIFSDVVRIATGGFRRDETFETRQQIHAGLPQPLPRLRAATMTPVLTRIFRAGRRYLARTETHFEREYHIRYEDLVRRRNEEAELYRQLRRRISL